MKAVLDGHALGDPSMLAFRDPETFVAGNLYSRLPAWELIAKCAPYVYVYFLLEVMLFLLPFTLWFPFEVVSVLGFSFGDFLLRLGMFGGLPIIAELRARRRRARAEHHCYENMVTHRCEKIWFYSHNVMNVRTYVRPPLHVCQCDQYR